MSKFIQYVGTPQQINQVIRDLVSSDTKLIDLTGDKELESLFNLYSSFNPFKEDIRAALKSIKNYKAKKYIINGFHVLNLSDIEPLIDLYKENDIDILLFSNFEPLDLKIPSIKGISINEPLPYFDYSLSLSIGKKNEQKFGNIFDSNTPDIDMMDLLKQSAKSGKPFVVMIPNDMLNETSNVFLAIANDTIKRALQDDDCDSVNVVYLKQK
ncbi:hypothetical protein [Aliarcobacter butzleri]|uniref:hypothetical protein n=1 Tax=Aliarcobacter butzleri TaxID=28197 RepID=UPI001269947C|nr:hypothetical protein [Aliarcobacter butzleri]